MIGHRVGAARRPMTSSQRMIQHPREPVMKPSSRGVYARSRVWHRL